MGAAGRRPPSRVPAIQLVALTLLLLAIAVAGCGDDDGGVEPTSPEEASPTEGTSTVSTDLDEKPSIEVPDGPPPPSLAVDDVVEGDGATAQPGDRLEVDYLGVAYSTGREFDSSWGGKPFAFELGTGMVIPGWDQGLEGMKVGGRRQLTIPPELAYGTQGVPPDIGPNETLIFVVDLLDVRSG